MLKELQHLPRQHQKRQHYSKERLSSSSAAAPRCQKHQKGHSSQASHLSQPPNQACDLTSHQL
eukprot:scaffold389791_cov45-Prasinocladus_malaysianus.AAC.1